MIVTPDTKPFDFLKSDLVRSTGLHASDIYGDLFKYLEPNRYDREGDANPLLLALGTAWENHFEYLMVANGIDAQRPGEFLSPEGIAYSPDLLIFNGVTRVGEIKLTSMDLDECPVEEDNNLPVKFDKYLCQLKLYCYWLDYNNGWLGVVSIRKPYNPTHRFYNLTFTDRELAENHAMCMRHARFEGMLK